MKEVGKDMKGNTKRYKGKGDTLEHISNSPDKIDQIGHSYVKKIEADLQDSFMYALKVRCGDRKKYSETKLTKALNGKNRVQFLNCMTAHLRRKIRAQISKEGKANLLNKCIEYVRTLDFNGSIQDLPLRDLLWMQIVGGELLFKNQSKSTDELYPIFEKIATDIPNLPHHKFIKAVQAEADKRRIPVSKSTLQRLYKKYFFK